MSCIDRRRRSLLSTRYAASPARGFFPGPRFLLSFARLRPNLSPNVAAAAGKHFRSLDRGGGALALALFPPPGRMVAQPPIQLWVGRAVPGAADVLVSLATPARASAGPAKRLNSQGGHLVCPGAAFSRSRSRRSKSRLALLELAPGHLRDRFLP